MVSSPFNTYKVITVDFAFTLVIVSRKVAMSYQMKVKRC